MLKIEMIPYFERAKQIIASGFTKEILAKDAAGCGVDEMSPEASCFCALGALRRAVGEKLGCEWRTKYYDSDKSVSHFTPSVADAYDEMREVLRSSIPGGCTCEAHLPGGCTCVMSYNDRPTTTQEDIVALFDRCIQFCQKAA